MALTSKKWWKRERIRSIEANLINSCLSSERAEVAKFSIIGQKLLKLMEEVGVPDNVYNYTTFTKRNVVATGNNPPPVPDWSWLNNKDRIDKVKSLLDICERSGEEILNKFWSGWSEDQANWIRKVIRNLKDVGPYYSAGSLLTWPHSVTPIKVYPIEEWDETIKNIQKGQTSGQILIHKPRSIGPSSYGSSSSWAWGAYGGAGYFLKPEASIMALGETIIIGESGENFVFVRAAKILAQVWTWEQVWNVSTMLSPQNKLKALKKQEGKVISGFICWNAFKGMPKIPNGGKLPTNGFPALIRKPTQLSKEGGLQFILPADGRNPNLEIEKVISGYVKNNLGLEEDLAKSIKKYQISSDPKIAASWRKMAGNFSYSPTKNK